MARSYGQYCGVARALDVIGGRWTLLIIRELLVRPARYGELQDGLPGIATNLLAARLRDLEDAGLIRRKLDEDAMAVVYELTSRGEGLRPTVEELVKWATPLMVTGPGTDQFRNEWLVVAVLGLMRDRQWTAGARVAFTVDDQVVGISAGMDGARVELDPDDAYETMVHCEAAVVLGLASGMLSVDDAIAASTQHQGGRTDLEALFGASLIPPG